MSEAQTHSCSTPTPTAMFSSAPWELSAITDQDLFFFLVSFALKLELNLILKGYAQSHFS